jgi:hypothetical protein
MQVLLPLSEDQDFRWVTLQGWLEVSRASWIYPQSAYGPVFLNSVLFFLHTFSSVGL